MSKRERIELIKQYIRAHGPSPWDELMKFTGLPKATLFRLLDEPTFTITPMPPTLYNITGAKPPETKEQLLNYLIMRLARIKLLYGQFSYDEAEAKAEVQLNKVLLQLEQLLKD